MKFFQLSLHKTMKKKRLEVFSKRLIFVFVFLISYVAKFNSFDKLFLIHFVYEGFPKRNK